MFRSSAPSVRRGSWSQSKLSGHRHLQAAHRADPIVLEFGTRRTRSDAVVMVNSGQPVGQPRLAVPETDGDLLHSHFGIPASGNFHAAIPEHLRIGPNMWTFSQRRLSTPQVKMSPDHAADPQKNVGTYLSRSPASAHSRGVRLTEDATSRILSVRIIVRTSQSKKVETAGGCWSVTVR